MSETNNSSDIKHQGVQYFNGTGTFSGIDGSTAGKVLTSNGTGVAPSFQVAGVPTFQVVTQVFTSSGTYTPTAGMAYCVVELVGGGGGGGGCDQTSVGTVAVGGGGASGSYSRKTLSAATVGASQSITIGAAGTAGSSTTPWSGGNGGTTSFGAIFNATGGNAGGGSAGGVATVSGTAGNQPGGSTGADFSCIGQAGTNGFASVIATLTIVLGGAGGSTFFGGGGQGVNTGSSGINASSYGGGGGGAANQQNTGVSRSGGAGFAGIAVVTEFIT